MSDRKSKRVKLVRVRRDLPYEDDVEQRNSEFREMFLTYVRDENERKRELRNMGDQKMIQDILEIDVENFSQLCNEARKLSKSCSEGVPLRFKDCDEASSEVNIKNDQHFQELDDGTEIMMEISTSPTMSFLNMNLREAKNAPDNETLKSVLAARLVKFPDLMEFMTSREIAMARQANIQFEQVADTNIQKKLKEKLDVKCCLRAGVVIITKDRVRNPIKLLSRMKIPKQPKVHKFQLQDKKEIKRALKRRNIPNVLVSERFFQCSRCDDVRHDADTLAYKLLRRPKLISILNRKQLETVAHCDLARVRAPRIVSNYVRKACTVRLNEILKSNLIEAFLEMSGETIGT